MLDGGEAFQHVEEHRIRSTVEHSGDSKQSWLLEDAQSAGTVSRCSYIMGTVNAMLKSWWGAFGLFRTLIRGGTSLDMYLKATDAQPRDVLATC